MNYKNLVLGTLSNDAFVMVNKNLAQKIGFVEAGLLGEIISLYRMVKANDAFYDNKDGKEWFFVTQPFIEKHLGIKRTTYETAIKGLVKEKVIYKKRLDLPAKNHFNIDWERIAVIMSELREEEIKEAIEKVESPKKVSKSPSLSDCGNPANKNAEILQTNMEESRKLDVPFSTPIRITNNNNQQNKSFDDDEKILNNISEPKLMTFDIMDNLPTGMVKTENAKEAKLQIYKNFYSPLKAWLFEFGISHKKVLRDIMNALYDYEFYWLHEDATKKAITTILEKIKKGYDVSSLGAVLAAEIVQSHEKIKGLDYLEEQQKMVALYNLQQAEAVKHIVFYNWLDEREESPMQIEESDLEESSDEDEDIFASAYERLRQL